MFEKLGGSEPTPEIEHVCRYSTADGNPLQLCVQTLKHPDYSLQPLLVISVSVNRLPLLELPANSFQ